MVMNRIQRFKFTKQLNILHFLYHPTPKSPIHNKFYSRKRPRFFTFLFWPTIWTIGYFKQTMMLRSPPRVQSLPRFTVCEMSKIDFVKKFIVTFSCVLIVDPFTFSPIIVPCNIKIFYFKVIGRSQKLTKDTICFEGS